MSSCDCEAPTDFRATSENAGEGHLYLRCSNCGGKVGRVDINLRDLFEHVPAPEELDTQRVDVAEKIVEHKVPTVSIHFNAYDSPFTFIHG